MHTMRSWRKLEILVDFEWKNTTTRLRNQMDENLSYPVITEEILWF